MTAPDTKELVERYDASAIMMGIDGIEEKPSPNGKWVRYSDYQALATALEAMQRENARLQIDASNHAADAETVRRERDAAESQLAALKAEVEGLREALRELPYIVEYRRSDDGIEWKAMAAFDVAGAAERYCEGCEKAKNWEYRVRRAALNGGAGK